MTQSYATSFVLDKEVSEMENDTDDVSNKPICQQSSDVRQALDVL